MRPFAGSAQAAISQYLAKLQGRDVEGRKLDKKSVMYKAEK
jgi:hypothetical protein